MSDDKPAKYRLISDFVRAEPGLGAAALTLALQALSIRHGESGQFESLVEDLHSLCWQMFDERPMVYGAGRPDEVEHFAKTMALIGKRP